MSYQFYVHEESGEKIYKLIVIRFSDRKIMKIISKESRKKRIHFIVRLLQNDSASRGIFSEETKYKSTENGVTKKQFNNMVHAMIAKLPPQAESKINDLSNYSSLTEQFNAGVLQDILSITTKPTNDALR